MKKQPHEIVGDALLITVWVYGIAFTCSIICRWWQATQ
jgi:hypothetical protein